MNTTIKKKSTRLYYLSTNIALDIFLFKKHCNFILGPNADEYKEWNKNNSYQEFTKKVKDSLQMNNV